MTPQRGPRLSGARTSRDEADLSRLTSTAVIDFVLSASRSHTTGNAKSVTTRLRSFLRYLNVEGLTGDGLVMAVPSVAGWQLTALPQGLDPEDVVRLLKSCDRRRARGRRDFAILTVLARLGLRGLGSGRATAGRHQLAPR